MLVGSGCERDVRRNRERYRDMRVVVVQHSEEGALADPQLTQLLVLVPLKVLRLPQDSTPFLHRHLSIPPELADDESFDQLAECDVGREGERKIHDATHGALRVGWSER